MNKKLCLCLACSLLLAGSLAAAPQSSAAAPAKTSAAAASTQENAILLSNQMMLTIMERMKNGDLAQAKEIAQEMIAGHDSYQDSPTMIYRCFSSLMGKTLFEIQAEQAGEKRTINWLEQPVADGFYFLAMITFQEGDKAKALEYLQKAIQWDPVRAAFYIERGYMLMHQDGAKELGMIAASYLKAAELADSPEDFAAALRGIGFTYVEKGDLETGMACYLLSLSYEPGSQAARFEMDFIARRSAAGRNMDVTKARALLAQKRLPTRINPVHVQVLYRLADSLSKEKNVRQLQAVYRRILSIDPDNKEAKTRLQALR